MHDLTPTTGPQPGPAAASPEPAPPEVSDGAAAMDHAEPRPAPATGGPRPRTLGLLALAGAVVVGALVVGFAAGGGGASTPDSAAPAAALRQARISEAAWTSPDGRTQLRVEAFDGRGMRGGHERGAITITAMDGSKLSLRTDDGWTRTIDAAGATVTKDGATVALSSLKVGDRIAFRETRNDDGTYTITAIVVVQPTVVGTVASVAGSTVTVTTADGGTTTVILTGSTTYRLGGQAATKDAVVAGVRIAARGTLADDGKLTASAIQVTPAMAAGTVKEKGASSLTITLRDGSTLVVKVSSSTTYRVDALATATLADIDVGDVVMASGTKNADGSLTATVVRAQTPGEWGGPWPGDGRGGFGPGGGLGPGGGFGPGMRGDGDGWGFPGGWGPEPAPSASPSGTSG